MELIIEKGNDGMLWGRIEVPEGDYLPVTAAKNTEEVIGNIRMLIKEHQQSDGEDVNFFKDVNSESVNFHISYDIQSLFIEFSFLKITEMAKEADLNPGLVRQYASGVKHASSKQAKKIEETIHHLAQRMLEVSLV